MLPIKNRLKKREDFAKVFSKGAYVGNNDLSVKYANNSLSETRFGFPVGKNYSKKAVVRNRARRILRLAIAYHLSKIKPGFDIIILIKPTYQKTELPIVINEFKKIFSNLLI